ncbi:hypothetical protein AgCh_033072 [Apium graveolens]
MSFEESIDVIKELKTESLMIEDESLTTLNNDLEDDDLSMLNADVNINSEEEHATKIKINDVVIEDNVSEDDEIKESNTAMMVVSLSQIVPKLPFLNLDIAYMDQRLGTSVGNIVQIKKHMSQEFEISDLVLERSGMTGCNVVKFPMESKLVMHKDENGYSKLRIDVHKGPRDYMLSGFSDNDLAATACQGIWLYRLLSQIADVRAGPVLICIDNKSAIDLARKPEMGFGSEVDQLQSMEELFNARVQEYVFSGSNMSMFEKSELDRKIAEKEGIDRDNPDLVSGEESQDLDPLS